MKTSGFSDDNTQETEIVKCDGCGANMVFSPEDNCLICKHCGSKKDIVSKGQTQEIDILSGFDKQEQFSNEEAIVFKCDNCGAKVVLTKNETANKCPFCGTAHVTKLQELAGIKPNGIIPFRISADQAVAESKKWAKKKIYAPRKFKKNLNTENVKGVYVPCFTFDSYTSTRYSGRIGITHVRTSGSGKNAKTTTWTEWKNISGTYYDNFDDVLISAGSKFEQDKLDRISPYNTNFGEKFEEKFMLGYMAYHYDYRIEDCWGQAKTRIDDAIKRKILSKYTYDKVAYFNMSTVHERVTYKYEMLPVYVGSFTYMKKLYNFYVNGETSKVYGKTPVSAIKIIATVLVGLGLIALVVFLYLSGFFD